MIIDKEYYPEDPSEVNPALGKEISYRQRETTPCPNVRNPFEDCYCVSTSSAYAEATIHYCGGCYKECEIYAKHAAGGAGNT